MQNDVELADDLVFQVLISRMRKDSHCLLKTGHVKRLIKLCTVLFQKEPTQLHLDGETNYVIVGDLHGNIDDLVFILQTHGYPPETNYIFLGDYVDRGKNSIEVLLLLYALKVKFPTKVYLLRGNHEEKSKKGNSNHHHSCGAIFRDECEVHLNKRCHALFCKSFSYLPLTAILNSKIFCVHGGFSQNLIDLHSIAKIEKPIRDISLSVASDLLWSDPSSKIQMFSDSPRGNGCLYGQDSVDQFLLDNELTAIIRAHEFCNEGFKWSLDNCLTVFSAADYMGAGNKAGVSIVNGGEVNISTFDKNDTFKVIIPLWVFEDNKGMMKVPFDGAIHDTSFEEVELDSTLLIL